MAGRVPEIVQFGAGPLSVIDPTQAPPGKHTQYAWHVMPLDPDIGGQDYEAFKREFAEQDHREVVARYAPNMTRKNIIGAVRLHRARIRRASSRRCAAATSSWARSTPSR